MTGRRELGLAVVVAVVGGALAWLAAGRVWATVRSPQGGLPSAPGSVTGGSLAPGLTALAIAGLAGGLALLATRSWGRLLLGVLLGALGVGVVVLAVDGTGHGALASALESLHTVVSADQPARWSAWPWVAVAGGVLLVAAGLLVAVRGRRWPGIGGRYENPRGRRQPVDPTVSAWDALDRGEDPTA